MKGDKKIVTINKDIGLPYNFTDRGFKISEGIDNSIILFGYGIGFSIYNNGSFQSFSVENGLPDNRVTSIDVDSNGIIWIL